MYQVNPIIQQTQLGMKLFFYKNSSILLLLFIAQFTFAQQATLNGKVMDIETNEPLISATIKVGTVGTVTDFDGNYSIQVPAGTYDLEYTYIGFETKSESISLNEDEIKTLDIALGVATNLLQTATVTSGKYEKPLGELTVSLEVLKADLIENTATTSVDEVLEKLPGVSIIDGQANIRGGSGWSYGAGSRVLLLIDDIPALQADAGFPNWDDVPIENTEQVEVVKGAASALYGSSALNGIINIRTAYATSKPVTKISTFYTNWLSPKDEAKKWWDTPRFESGVSLAHRQKFNKFDLVLSAYGLYRNSFRQNSDNQYGRITVGTRYRITDKLSIGFNSNFNRGKGGSYFYWKDWESGAYQPDTSTISNSDRFRYTIDPFVTFHDESGGRHKLTGRYHGINNNNDNNQSNFSDLYYGEYQYQKKIESLGLVTTAGLVGTWTKVRAPLYGDTTFHSNNTAAYLQLEKKFFDRLNISGGARYERNVQKSPEFFLADTIPNGRVIESKPVFRLGANYKVSEATFLRASWGQGYRYPTIAERFISTSVGGGIRVTENPSLTSETGWSAEIGIKQGFRIDNFNGFFDLAFFHTEYQNMIEFNLDRFTFPPAFQAQNIGDTKIRGVDFNITGQGEIAGVKTSILTGYTYIDPKFVDFNIIDSLNSTSDENILKYRFKHSFKLDIQSDFNNLAVGIALFYNSEMKAVDDILNRLNGIGKFREANPGGNLKVDGRISYKIKKAKFSLIGRNLFNKEIMLRPGVLDAPRNITFRVDYTL